MKTDKVYDIECMIYSSNDDRLCVYNDNGYLYFQYKRKDGSIFSTYDYVEITSVLIGDNFTFDGDFLSIAITEKTIENISISNERILISVLYDTNILEKIDGNINDILPLLERKFKRTIKSLYNSKNIKEIQSKFLKKMHIAAIYEFLLHKAVL